MNTTIKTLVNILAASIMVGFAFQGITPAVQADDGDAISLTIRLTDEAAVARQIGACDTGYYVLGVVDGRTRSYSFGIDAAVTITARDGVHTPPYLQLACEGVGRGMPSNGVTVELH